MDRAKITAYMFDSSAGEAKHFCNVFAGAWNSNAVYYSYYVKYHKACKHVANDCVELGWSCVPLAVETYGNWGREAEETFSRLANPLAASYRVSKSKTSLFNFTLTRSVTNLRSWWQRLYMEGTL